MKYILWVGFSAACSNPLSEPSRLKEQSRHSLDHDEGVIPLFYQVGVESGIEVLDELRNVNAVDVKEMDEIGI